MYQYLHLYNQTSFTSYVINLKHHVMGHTDDMYMYVLKTSASMFGQMSAFSFFKLNKCRLLAAYLNSLIKTLRVPILKTPNMILKRKYIIVPIHVPTCL